jgi:hypothetical protein
LALKNRADVVCLIPVEAAGRIEPIATTVLCYRRFYSGFLEPRHCRAVIEGLILREILAQVFAGLDLFGISR